MSGKKSRGPASNDEPAPRPIALLVAVVFAAAVSTWHWYRPLPPRATAVSNGPFVSESVAVIAKESPRFKSKWKDSGLIFPSEDPMIEPKSERAISTSQSPEKSNRDSDAGCIESLTGNRELALQPFREATQPIQQSISQTPLPMVPVMSTQETSPPSPPESRLWTAAKRTEDPLADEKPNAEFESHNSNTLAESASPFRVPRIEGDVRKHGPIVAQKSEIWPDQGFDPKGAIAIGQDRNTSIATGNGVPYPGVSAMAPSSEHPGVLSLSSNRIRTLDQEPVTTPSASNGLVNPRKQPSPANSPANNTIVPNPLRTQDGLKKGSVIRQPPPKVTK